LRRVDLAPLRLRRARAARCGEPALVRCDQPGRAFARGRLREPAAVPGGDLLSPDPVGVDRAAPDRGRPRDRRRDRALAHDRGGGLQVSAMRERLARTPPGYRYSIGPAGSARCGAAQNMGQPVIFRAIQGIGAGGLFPLTLAMVGMIVPPRDRGRYQGLIGSVFAAASIAGPLIGGFIVDNFSWRWIFYVNLPVGGVAMAVILVTMPKRPYKQEHSIDWFGAGILALGTTSL